MLLPTAKTPILSVLHTRKAITGGGGSNLGAIGKLTFMRLLRLFATQSEKNLEKNKKFAYSGNLTIDNSI